MKKNIKLRFVALIFALILVSTNIYAATYTFDEHETAMSHTKREIVSRMDDIIKYNYNNSEYLVNPSSTAPYVAGSLQKGVIDDTVRNVNFYRWLVGLNPVYANNAKMERNQKGAVVLAATRTLTHTPSKPSDMDDDFYKEAYAGCYYGTTTGDYYSGNCSLDYVKMPYVIDGYVSDIYNVDTTYGAVGHRNSILDPLAYAVSFGKCGNYSTLSMYYALSLAQYNALSENPFNYEAFFAYPSPGNFPKELFATNEYWSVYFCYSAAYPDTMTATFEYNGKEYPADEVIKEYGEPIVSFKIPASLKKALGNSNTMPACQIKVKVDGYVVNQDDGATAEVIYTVNFFDRNSMVQDFTLDNTSVSISQGQSKKVNVTTSPKNSVADSIVWSTEDTHYVRVSEDGTIRAIRPGTATVKVSVDGIEKTVTVTIDGDMNYLLGDLDRNGVVDANDASVALELYKSTEGDFEIEDLIRGDLDENDVIDANDASLILEIYKTNN